jgi:hypothetical protein
MAIGGLLLLGYILLHYELGLTSAAATAATPVPPTPTPALIDLWRAHGQACAVARAQAEDAQLVSATTQWQAVSEETLLDGASNWSFVFYSAKNSSVLDVVVDAGAARVVNQTRVWTAPKVMAAGGWHEGPRDALLVFLAHDGRAFLEGHPQAVVDLHLAESEDDGPAWSIVALDVGDRSLLSLLIDADTMQVLSNQS